ncbi:MAG: TlpA family protein disulfide reductase [Chlorobi bacterium]|nr:TlpA family protein disulfide reductase [Chlorobiota bacterium]
MRFFFQSILIFMFLVSNLESSDLIETIGEPVSGNNYIVKYNTQSERSIFESYEDVNASVFVYFNDDERFLNIKGDYKDSIFEFEIPVPEQASLLWIHFYSKSSGKCDKVQLFAGVFNDKGINTKGAHTSSILFSIGDVEEYFQEEISLYPDSYKAYYAKWRNSDYYGDKIDSVLAADIKYLRTITSTTDELLFIYSYYETQKNNFAKAEEYIRELHSEYPTSYFTSLAFSKYSYGSMIANRIDSDEYKEIALLNLQTIKEHPDAYVDRSSFSALISNNIDQLSEVLTIEELTMIFRNAVAKEPSNPAHYIGYASGLVQLNADPDRILELLYKCADLILKKECAYFNGGDDSYYFSYYLPNAYLMAAKIHFKKNNFARALADLQIAKKYAERQLDEILLLEGKMWQKSCFLDEAESKYFEASKLKNRESADSLKSIYLTKHETLAGFDKYLSGSSPKSFKPDKSATNPAPEFEGVTIEGKKYKLSELKGKVVVLNFWFIGCAGCSREIPELNRMRAKYKNKDVVFLAFALNDANTLKHYQKKKPFDYELFAESTPIADTYSVSGYPTHFIIDKNGNIIKRFTTSFSKDNNQLEAYIDKCLAE